MERLLNVAVPFTAFTDVVPLNVPLPGLLRIAMATEAELFATNLLPESRTCTVTAGVIEAPAAVFDGCTEKAKWVAPPNTTNVPVPEALFPLHPLPAVAVTVKLVVLTGVAPVVLIWSVAVFVSPPAPESDAGIKVAVAPAGSAELTLKVVLQAVAFPPKVTVTK